MFRRGAYIGRVPGGAPLQDQCKIKHPSKTLEFWRMGENKVDVDYSAYTAQLISSLHKNQPALKIGNSKTTCPGLRFDFLCWSRIQMTLHTTYVYLQSTTVYVPSSELRLSHPPSRQRVCPSPRSQRGAHSPAGEGLGESQFRRLEKKLNTLPPL